MNELTIELSTESGKCLYEQIYEYIRKEIREGKLLQGEKLPSTRALAAFLQVARSTVELAYEQLLSEGYVESVPYKGYFVCRMEELYHIETKTEKEENEKAHCVEKYEIDFSPNGIEMEYFPYEAWKRISKNTLNDGRKEMFALGSPQGDFELRATIAKYLYGSRGVHCLPEQIIVGAGNDFLLLLLEKILGRHVRIGMETQTYRRAYRIFNSFAYEICPVKQDGAGIVVEELEKSGASAVYVMPSHQFPTGNVMPIGRRTELLKWAYEKEERYIIEDDYDSEFRYKGKPIPSLQASDKMEKVIYIGTFSKAIAPAIRISFMVLPKRLLKFYKENLSFYSSTVSRIDQMILNDFIKDGYFERYLNKMRKVYKAKHDLLVGECKSLEAQFELSGENAGLHVLLRSKKGKSEKELIDRAAGYGIKVYGLSDGYITEEKPETHTVLLGYGGLKETEIQKGIKQLKRAWSE